MNDRSNHSELARKLELALRRFKQGQLGEAGKLCEQVLAGKPNDVDALKILGAVLARSGNVRQAIPVAQRVCHLSPGDANAHSNLSYLHGLNRNFQQALLAMAYAVNCEPQNTVYHDKFARLIDHMEFYRLTSETAVIQQAIIVCLGNSRLDPTPFSTAWHSLLLLDPFYGKLAATAAGEFDQRAGELPFERLKKPLADPFLLLGLRSLIAVDERLERALTFLRRLFLSRVGEYKPRNFLPFLCALAEHCIQNEYVFACSREEQARVDALAMELQPDAAADAGAQASIALVLSYGPSLPFDPEAITPRPESGAFGQLLETVAAFSSPSADSGDSGPGLPAAAPNTVSASVARQYEENPYPRWRHLDIPALSEQQKEQSRGRKILVAGCGTGFEPLNLASLYPGARVVGLDLSAASLAYARRKAKEFGIENAEFVQGDILDVESLGETFDLVSSVGVLHHMEDPVAGWRKLVRCLKPDGLMNIALYSEAARKNVVECRNWIEQEGFEPTPEGIRAFRQAVMALDEDNPLRDIMTWTDFYSMSMCRDLVFHVQEHRVTLPWIQATLDDLGLCCVRMRISNPAFRNEYRSMNPDDTQLNDLEKLHEYEQRNPAAFRDMYQFRCCRPESETAKRPPAWLQAGA